MSFLDAALMLILLLGVVLLGSNRLGAIIQIFALQSLMVSCVPVLIAWPHIGGHVIAVATGSLIIKVFVMPNFLFWAIRHVHIRREVYPLLGYATTMLLGGVLTGTVFLISSKLNLPQGNISNLLIPTAFSIIAMGFLLLVSRLKALTQVIGYLVMENGIFLFSAFLLDKTPLIVEMGILLDVFVAVLVMGVVVNHINEEFEDTNTLHVTTLRD